MAQITSQSDKSKELKQTLNSLIENYRQNPEEIAELLAFKNRFYSYSMNNNILIFSQNSAATFVASYGDWKKKGYQIQKGQHGIKIIFPIHTEIFEVGEKDGKKQYRRVADASPQEKVQIQSGLIKPFSTTRFGVGNVFDISQTDCPAEDYPKIYHTGYSSEQHSVLYDAIKSFAADKGNPVIEKDLQSISLRGQFSPLTGEIQINDKLNDTEKLSTLTHEFGHALLHGDPTSLNKNSSVKELEADCISIMLQQEFGIELTDSRKKHFFDHYNMCENLDDFKLEDVLKNVSTAYLNLRKELDPMIENAISQTSLHSQYGTIDITKSQINFDFSNYLTPGKALYLINMGVPVGSISNFDSQNNRIEKHDEPVGEVHTMYLPINSVEELAEHNVQHFESMTIHPNFMNTEQMQHYMYVMEMLSDKNLFTLNEINSFEQTFNNSKPFIYEKMMNMRDEFITEEKVKQWVELGDGDTDLNKQVHAFMGLGMPSDENEMAQRETEEKATEQSTAAAPTYTHFYYENEYLFTVTGEKSAQEVYDRLSTDTKEFGYFWSDSGSAYKSDQEEAPTSDLWNADKTKTANVPFTEKHYQNHIQYMKQMARDYQEKEPADDLIAVETKNKASASPLGLENMTTLKQDSPKQPAKREKKGYQDYQEQDASVLEYIKHNVSILTIAKDMGFTVQQIGSYYTLKEYPNSARIYPQTNSFTSFSEQQDNGKYVGGSTIDFAMNYGGYNQKDAIQILKERYVGDRLDSLPQYVPTQPITPSEPKTFDLPEKAEGKFSRAFAYLTKTRCLDADVVQSCMKSGLIYEDNKHNVVFVGNDADGKTVFATRHTTLTNSDFKRDVAGSRQDVGFMVDNKADRLYVTEAPIDALSIMCLRKQEGKAVEKASYMATCGTGKDAALYYRLSHNPHIKEIILANDNDDAGQKANRKIFDHLRVNYPDIKISCLKPKGKDINEHLCKFCAEKCTPKNPKKSKGQEVER